MLAFYSLFLSAKLQKINDICKKISNYFSINCIYFYQVKYEYVLRNKFGCFKENLYLCSPSMEALSYRPRNAGHDYYGRGTYLITLVVSGREQLLSHFVTDLGREHPTSGREHPTSGRDRFRSRTPHLWSRTPHLRSQTNPPCPHPSWRSSTRDMATDTHPPVSSWQ